MTPNGESGGSASRAQTLCSLPSRITSSASRLLVPRRDTHAFLHPFIKIGSRREYLAWETRARTYLQELGGNPETLDRVDATFNYARNRVLLFNLPEPARDLSIAETVSHEILHSLLEQLRERWAARTLDRVARPVGSADRAGGI